ncbi:MAG: hypothetical protein IID36_02235, partial [Planctomycetes bacterium]|nr:hypothetical protein [Planctomycetota bacterium]
MSRILSVSSVLSLMLISMALGQTNARVTLVPEQTGDLVPGSILTVDVEVSNCPISPQAPASGPTDIPDLRFIRLDFANNIPGFNFISFTFDPSAFPGVNPADYAVSDDGAGFVQPTVTFIGDPNVATLMTLPLVPTKYASFEVQIPPDVGTFILDSINDANFVLNDGIGALLQTGFDEDTVNYEKNDAECLPGTLCVEDGLLIINAPLIPTVAEWGMIALTLSLLLAGGAILARRKRVAVRA